MYHPRSKLLELVAQQALAFGGEGGERNVSFCGEGIKKDEKKMPKL